MSGHPLTISLYFMRIYFSIFLHNTKSHQVFYVPIKSPNLDSTGLSVVIFTFDVDVKGKKS